MLASQPFLSMRMLHYKTSLQEIPVLVKSLDEDVKSQMPTDDKNARIDEHNSSPFCWLETLGVQTTRLQVVTPIGGRDKLQAWALKTFPGDADIGTHK